MSSDRDRGGARKPLSGDEWRQEARSFVRAFSGAFLFGVPLLYTMEMWWFGDGMGTARQLAFVGVAFFGNLALSNVVGFKQDRHDRNWGRIDQAFDAVAVGLVSSAAVLLALARIGAGDPLQSVVGKVVAQALPMSLGVSLANAIFSSPRAGDGGRQRGARSTNGGMVFVRDVGATFLGATFICASIAPTQEIDMLATGMRYPHLVATAGLSLVLAYAIVFASGFDPRAARGQRGTIFERPASETLLAYVVSLVVAAGSLYLFGRLQAGQSAYQIAGQAIVLGLPAAVGGAAGRVAI